MRRPPQGKWLGREDPGAAPKPGAPRPRPDRHPDPRRSPGGRGEGRALRAREPLTCPRNRGPGCTTWGRGRGGQGGGSDREGGPGGDLGPSRDPRGRGSCAAQPRPTWLLAFGVT